MRHTWSCSVYSFFFRDFCFSVLRSVRLISSFHVSSLVDGEFTSFQINSEGVFLFKCVQIFAETKIAHLNGCWFHAAIPLKLKNFGMPKTCLLFQIFSFAFSPSLIHPRHRSRTAGIAKGGRRRSRQQTESNMLLVQLRKTKPMDAKDKWSIIYHSSHVAIVVSNSVRVQHQILICFRTETTTKDVSQSGKRPTTRFLLLISGRSKCARLKRTPCPLNDASTSQTLIHSKASAATSLRRYSRFYCSQYLRLVMIFSSTSSLHRIVLWGQSSCKNIEIHSTTTGDQLNVVCANASPQRKCIRTLTINMLVRSKIVHEPYISYGRTLLCFSPTGINYAIKK